MAAAGLADGLTEHRRNDQRNDGQHKENGIAAGIPFVEFLCAVAGAADSHREPEDEQQVANDRAGDGGFDQLEQAGLYGGDGDNKLGGVAEGGIEQRANTRVGMSGKLFRGLPDIRGKGNDAEGGQREDGHGGPAKQLARQR